MSSGDGTGSQPAKPKFRPKAQVRKKPAPPPPPAASDYRAGAANYRTGGGGGDGGGSGRGGRGGGGGRGQEYEGRGRHRQWDDRSRHGGGGRGRDDWGGRGRGRDGRGGRGRGRGGFIPVGQDFFVGGGGSGTAAYMPSGVTSGGAGGGGGARGGGDTSESEAEEQERKRLSKKKPSSGDRHRQLKAKGGSKNGSMKESDDDEDMFGTGEGVSGHGGGDGEKAGEEEEEEEGYGTGAGGAADGDGNSLIGVPGASKQRLKLPGMRVTGNVMSEADGMRPVALPVTATAQDPAARLFAPADNEAELTEEEDNSLFFIQLPTKLPRPLPAFQRDEASTTNKGKGKGKAVAGGHPVKEEMGAPAGAAGSGAAGAPASKATAETEGVPADDLAFDGGLRRMKPGKIGKLYVHQSGRARLVVGGVSLLVHPGLPVSFVEEGVSINAGTGASFCSFGQVTKRVVCTPDFEQLYRRVDENASEGVGDASRGINGAGLGADDGPAGRRGPVKMEI